jgi:hypothetical protein
MSNVTDSVTVEGWKTCLRHAERLQEDYFVKNVAGTVLSSLW